MIPPSVYCQRTPLRDRATFLVILFVWLPLTVAEDARPGPGPMVVVTSAQAPIEVNEDGVTRVLGTVPKGTRLWAISVQGDFARVVDPGSRQTGWISTRHATADNLFGQPAADIQSGFRLQEKAGVAIQKGDLVSAESLCRRALSVHSTVLGTEHPYTAYGQYCLGIVCQQSGQYTVALPLYQQALKIYERSLGASHSSTLMLSTRIGGVLVLQGEYVAAESFLQRALDATEILRGPEHIETAQCAHALGACFYSQSKLVDAELMLQRSLKIKEQVLGMGDSALVDTLSNLAVIRRDVGDFASSVKLFKRALLIQEDVKPPDAATLAHVVNGLGQVYKAQENYAAAEKMYLWALRLRESTLGSSHPETATCLHNLGQLKRSQLDFAAAASYLKRALKISEESLGPEHPETILSLFALAHSHLDMGDMKTTLPLFRRVLKVQESTFGSGHPGTANSLKTLAISLAAAAEDEEAAKRFDQERRVTNRYVKRVLPMLPENEQQFFLGNRFRDDQAIALSFGLHHAGTSLYSDLSAAWLLNGKSISQESLGQRNLLARDIGDSNLASKAVELLRVRSELAQLAMMLPDSKGAGAKQQHVDELKATERQLSREVGIAEKDSAGTTEKWVELNEIRATLSDDEVFVDIARIDVFHFRGHQIQVDRNRPHYVAWLTYGDESRATTVVDLGLASEIDELVASVRVAINSVMSVGLPADAEEGLSDQLLTRLQALADRVWNPLEPHVKSIESIILSPDGALWLAPWNALSVGTTKDEFLIERHSVCFVTSGRDLVRRFLPVETDSPVIVANPSFDQPAKQKQASIAEMFSQLPAARKSPIADFSSKNLLQKVGPLPNTGIEAEAIRPSVEKFAGKEARMFNEQYALESVVKALRSPKVVAFATHGFFLPSEVPEPMVGRNGVSNSTRSAAAASEPRPFENPLLRCGLLFSGCNSRDSAIGDDDGILTGLEILGVDFRGTELVVLSACDTGVGETSNGEGVAGLRQAFQLAGAQSVVSTLWQIPDRDSALIMTEFFTNLANGQSRGEALRNAQLRRIKSRRSRYGAAHPFYWAAWTYTGY